MTAYSAVFGSLPTMILAIAGGEMSDGRPLGGIMYGILLVAEMAEVAVQDVGRWCVLLVNSNLYSD